MTGTWITEEGNVTAVRIKALEGVPKKRALQIALGADWYPAKLTQGVSKMITQANDRSVEFSIKGVRVQVNIDAHRVRAKNGAKTKEFANFLNVKVDGLNKVKTSGVHLGGLLAYDDHSFATQVPDQCRQGKLAYLFQKVGSEDKKFLSNALAN